MKGFVMDNFGGGQASKEVDSVDAEVVAGLTKEQAQGILSGNPKFKNLASQVIAERARRLAPEGSLHLPPLLDRRRLEYAIPDDVFTIAASFDKVLVFQIPEEDGERVGDTSIIMPELTKERVKKESPIGIICSAGLEARNVLVTNGMDLGHKVAIVRLQPYRKEAGTTYGHRHEILIIRSGDIIGSMDLADEMKNGRVRIAWDDKSQQHVYQDESGKVWDPVLPMLSEV